MQVQATNPIANENTYENNGFSQVVTFRYGAKCLPPTAFTKSLKDLGIVTLSWQAAEAAQSYDVRYRLSGTSLWQNKSIYGNSITLPSLPDGSYEYQVMSNCGVGTQSNWGDSQSFILSNGLLIDNKAASAREASAASQTDLNTNSSSTSNDANDLLDRVMNPLANPVSSGPTLSQADIDSFFEKVPRPKCAGVADKTVSCDINTASYSGTPKDLLQVGDKIVINNYEVVLSEVTGGNGTFSGRGIAQFPFLAVRFPVIFSNISVVGAPEGDDPVKQERGGCVTGTSEIAVEGSDAGLLDRDVQTRLQNLYNQANNPTAFSGNFKEAIEAAKKMAAALLDKIAKGETPTAEEIGKYKNICKALNAGIEAWKQDIKNQFPAPRTPEIDQILANLESYNAKLQDLLNCNGQGYLKYGKNNNELYASRSDAEPGFYFVACNYLAVKEVAEELEKLTGLFDKDFNEVIKFLAQIKDCYNGWREQPNGIIPICLWKEKNEINPYFAGFIDRGWDFASGKDIKNFIGGFDQMYCAFNPIARWAQNKVGFGDCKDMSDSEAEAIRTKAYDAVSFLAKFNADIGFRVQVIAIASIEVDKYLAEVPKDKVKQHQVGGLLFDAVTIIGPLALKAAKASQILVDISSAVKESKFSEKFINLLKEKGFKVKSGVQGAGNRLARSIEQIAPNGIIPSNSQTNNLFHKWFDDLIPEELDLVLADRKLKDALADRIRYSPNGQGGMHEWCMVCEVQTFKKWEISMSEIHRFRTRTIDLKGVNPITGENFVHGGASSGTFHNELRAMIQQSSSLADFNTRLTQLITRWQIDPSLLPPLIK